MRAISLILSLLNVSLRLWSNLTKSMKGWFMIWLVLESTRSEDLQFGKGSKQIRSHSVMRQIENNINIIIYYIITSKKIIIISKMNVNYFNYFIWGLGIGILYYRNIFLFLFFNRSVTFILIIYFIIQSFVFFIFIITFLI